MNLCKPSADCVYITSLLFNARRVWEKKSSLALVSVMNMSSWWVAGMCVYLSILLFEGLHVCAHAHNYLGVKETPSVSVMWVARNRINQINIVLSAQGALACCTAILTLFGSATTHNPTSHQKGHF